jgi:hypothetical protein
MPLALVLVVRVGEIALYGELLAQRFRQRRQGAPLAS